MKTNIELMQEAIAKMVKTIPATPLKGDVNAISATVSGPYGKRTARASARMTVRFYGDAREEEREEVNIND